MGDVVGFFRKNGRVIPIRSSSGAGHAAKASSKIIKGATHVGRAASIGASAHAIHSGLKSHKSNERQAAIKVNRGLDALGLGLSVGTGVLGAATFGMGAKGFIAGSAATHAVDALGVGINAASVAGKGKTKERVKQAARQEARNLVVGNAVYAAGILAVKKNRQAAVTYAKTGAAYAKRILDFSRKALGVL